MGRLRWQLELAGEYIPPQPHVPIPPKPDSRRDTATAATDGTDPRTDTSGDR